MVSGVTRLFIAVVMTEIVAGPFTTSRRSVVVPRLNSCAGKVVNSIQRTEIPCQEYELGIEHENSWAPVKKILVFCPERIPKTRFDRRCNETTHCRNPVTKELAHNLSIYQVTRWMAFCVKTADGFGYVKEEETSVGCTCIFPVPV